MRSPPDAVMRRERAFAACTAQFARHLPEDLRFLAFTTPTSFREPEIDSVWHPIRMRRGRLACAIGELPALARACGGGARRFLRGRFGVCALRERPGATVLVVTPTSTCTRDGDRITTAYVHPDDVDAVNWLIFDDAARSDRRSAVDRRRYLVVFARLLIAWVQTECPSREEHARDWSIGKALLLRWVLHGYWATLLMYASEIESVLQRLRPQLVCCVHEVWPHARVLWSVAKRIGVRTATMQHASIQRTKLWYFPQAEELRVGYATPDVFAVFSEQDRTLLAPYYPPETTFPIACSPRYAPWKERAQEVNDSTAASEVLFVSSIPWWDIEVLVEAIGHLLASGRSRARVRVRLHPAAKPRFRSLRALRTFVRRGQMAFAAGSLIDSLARAAIVIGMNTTVLEEAALIGRAVLVLETDRFLSFAPLIGVRCAASALTWDAVDDARRRCAAERTSMAHAARVALGIDAPTFRVSACGSTGGARLGTLRERAPRTAGSPRE